MKLCTHITYRYDSEKEKHKLIMNYEDKGKPKTIEIFIESEELIKMMKEIKSAAA